MANIVLLLTIAFWLPQGSGALCYRPDGSSVGTDYQPCNSGGNSMCCATNRVGAHANTCRPDGLCYDLTSQYIWRESCTDPTWRDPACLQLCTTGLLGAGDGTESVPAGTANLTQSDVIVTTCGDGSYCCGLNNSTCCSSGSGYWIVDGKVYTHDSKPASSSATFSSLITSSTSTSSTSINPTTSTSSSPNINTSTPFPTSAPKKFNKAALGAGIGAGIPLLILVAVLVALLVRRRRRDSIPASYPNHIDTPIAGVYEKSAESKIAPLGPKVAPLVVAGLHGMQREPKWAELEGR